MIAWVVYDFKSIGLVEETKTDILMKSAGLYRGLQWSPMELKCLTTSCGLPLNTT